ncbi:SCO3374 family protein [Streptomyces sp. NPDC085932]|uniref:SCO3374 family protein n=1 Tax=Streptomyces sp. NPDC085932 TaxID=3365741 RepID=UPI0037D0EC1D
MFGALPSVSARTPGVVPRPRRCRVRRWYEDALGWPTAPGDPVRLALGVRFDVLDVPAEAGSAALRRLGPRSPVAVRGGRALLLVAAGSAEELPGLLEWLDWGALPLDLRALGSGAFMAAPLPPEAPLREEPPSPGGPDTRSALAGPHGVTGVLPPPGTDVPPPRRPAPDVPQPRVPAAEVPLPRMPGGGAGRPLPLGRLGSQGAAVWLRPPEPGCEVEASLPTLSALGGGGDAPDLVRLVDTVATQCHRARLRRAGAPPPALRAQGR